MASADRARRAYAKWGFYELGSKRFEKTVMAGLSDMVVLAKEINAPQVRL
jgi:ribosomal protein L30E